MKLSFYPRLAWTGIVKNRRLYFPYILSCMGMVFMFCILQSLNDSPALQQMRGGSSMEAILFLGKLVVAAFALIFLNYTNSFLIRRRKREFGLYNILGMDKKRICRVVLWESLLSAVFSLLGGLALGLAFSKFAELGLLRAIRAEVDYRFTVSLSALGTTAGVFSLIFAVILLKSVIQILRSDPLELLKSENHGEKAPKSNWLLAVPGVLLLGGAYYLAVTIQRPLTAMNMFFVAVLMVIKATYLLFIAGSVTLCRVLQKNRRFYYRKDRFVSVSSMTYRMKRNGAGLASICILSTMVLVILSSTSSLFFGMEDSLQRRYDPENQIALFLNNVSQLSDGTKDDVRKEYEKVFAAYGVEPKNVEDYGYATITCILNGEELTVPEDVYSLSDAAQNVISLCFLTAEDYARAMGVQLQIAPQEAYCCRLRGAQVPEQLRYGDMALKIVGQTETAPAFQDDISEMVPTAVLVISDYAELTPLQDLTDRFGLRCLTPYWYYGYDLEEPFETQSEVFRDLQRALGENSELFSDGNGYGYYSDCLANSREDFYTTYGGLFFIGVMLSIVFLFAAAMIIYYKQISEGYEDQARFGIMQKVGMTEEDIRKSINTQVRIVFFAPLAMAGLHLAFAFPMVWKILQLFDLKNLRTVIVSNIAAFVLFALIYAAVYRITAAAYYRIVSKGE